MWARRAKGHKLLALVHDGRIAALALEGFDCLQSRAMSISVQRRTYAGARCLAGMMNTEGCRRGFSLIWPGAALCEMFCVAAPVIRYFGAAVLQSM